MGYLVERAQLIDKLFRACISRARACRGARGGHHRHLRDLATATGIVGAVVTLMGLLAFPAMLKAGYNVKVAAAR